MNKNDFIFFILDTLGWIWFLIRKPFSWFWNLNWKGKVFLIVIILTLFDSLRFMIFSILVWVLQ